MLSQMMSCFGKKLQSFQEKNYNFGKYFITFFTMFLVLGLLFSPFFYNLDNILEMWSQLMLNFFGMIASDFTSQPFRLFCDKFGPFSDETFVRRWYSIDYLTNKTLFFRYHKIEKNPWLLELVKLSLQYWNGLF